MIHVHKGWTLASINEALDSLKYGMQHIRDYKRYPSYEYQQQRLGELGEVVGILREIRDELKRRAKP